MTLVWPALVVVPPGKPVDHVFLVMDRYGESELDYFRIGGRYSDWFGEEKLVETPIDFSVLSERDPDCRVVAVECIF